MVRIASARIPPFTSKREVGNVLWFRVFRIQRILQCRSTDSECCLLERLTRKIRGESGRSVCRKESRVELPQVMKTAYVRFICPMIASHMRERVVEDL